MEWLSDMNVASITSTNNDLTFLTNEIINFYLKSTDATSGSDIALQNQIIKKVNIGTNTTINFTYPSYPIDFPVIYAILEFSSGTAKTFTLNFNGTVTTKNVSVNESQLVCKFVNNKMSIV